MAKNYKSNKPCIVCGMNQDNMVTFHHVYTRKAYPEYSEEKWNLMPLCQRDHNQIHQIGTVSFSQKYQSVEDWLVKNGWELSFGGWRHPI